MSRQTNGSDRSPPSILNQGKDVRLHLRPVGIFLGFKKYLRINLFTHSWNRTFTKSRICETTSLPEPSVTLQFLSLTDSALDSQFTS